MKVADAVQQMSSLPLQRIVDSFTKDFPKLDAPQARDIILRNVDELTDPRRITSVLRFDGAFSEQIHRKCVLEGFVGRQDWAATENEIIESLRTLEQTILDAANDPNTLRYENAQHIQTLKDVTKAAVEDDQITTGELRLLAALLNSLGLSEKVFRIILAQLGNFPKTNNEPHTTTECRDALIKLQRSGIVFHCNKTENSPYIIPEEIRGAVMTALNLELGELAWERLLNKLKTTQLRTALTRRQLPVSGNKTDLIKRITASDLTPSQTLSYLSNEELRQLCAALPGVHVSGRKNERAERIINYFANLTIKEIPKEATPEERYYQFLTELAHRDRETLLANKIIRKDIDIERRFEQATQHLFTQKLGHTPLKMRGTEHPDGLIRFGEHTTINNAVLMWDNKSSENDYKFPRTHLHQFKRYIRDSESPVTCFLIIVGSADTTALENLWRLAADCPGTQIAIAEAEDLARLAEEWNQQTNTTPFDLEVFNVTGILNRTLLEQRTKLFN